MPKLTEIAGLQEVVNVDFDNLPDQFTIRTPLPQPGAGYVFKLPIVNANDDQWIADLMNDEKQARIGYSFSEGKEFRILDAPGDKSLIGQELRGRITNVEKKWDEEKSAASPFAHLLHAAFGLNLTGRPNLDYAKALIAVSGRAFAAGLQWTAYCNPKRDIYIPEDKEAGIEGGVQKGTPGCGQRYAQKQRTNKKSGEITLQIPRDPVTGKYEEMFLCAGANCQALVRCFSDFQNFQPAPEEFKALRAPKVAEPKVEERAAEKVEGAPASAGSSPAAESKPAKKVVAAAQ